MRPPWRSVSGALLLLLATASAGQVVVIEDWTANGVGWRGIPSGWMGEAFGRRAEYDFVVEPHDGQRGLHLKSHDEHSTIVKDLSGRVNLAETPILEWRWQATVLPMGADLRRRETTDFAAQLYVVWPRFPALLRSRIIGYVWDTTTPVGTIAKSRKTGTVTFIVLRSGPAELGHWLTERRNLAVDYQRVFGEPPDNPRALSIAIDSNDTHSTAESFIGPIVFRAPCEPRPGGGRANMDDPVFRLMTEC